MSQTPPPPPPPSGSDPSFESSSSSPPPPPPLDAGRPVPPPPSGSYPPPPPPPAGAVATPYPTGSAYPPSVTPYPPGAGYPMPQLQPQPYSGAGQPADLMPRFLAKLIDGAVMLGINVVVAGVFVGALSGGFTSGLLSTLLTTALTLGYYAFLESSRGQTIGKMALGLKVANLAGQNPTMEEALKRNAYFALSLSGILPVLGGFIAGVASIAAVISIAVTINGDTQLHRGWHDRFGGTQVIKTR